MLYPLFVGIGLAQAMTLYEPAFAVVARRYGAEARTGITTLALWGGFASTIFVPVIQLLLDQFGWRPTLMVLAFVNLAFAMTPHLAVIDGGTEAPAPLPHRWRTGQRSAECCAGRRSGDCWWPSPSITPPFRP